MRGIKRGKVILISFILLSILSISLTSASDIAYIYRYQRNVDKNILSVFQEMGLEVEQINENTLSSIDLSERTGGTSYFPIPDSIYTFGIRKKEYTLSTEEAELLICSDKCTSVLFPPDLSLSLKAGVLEVKQDA